MAESGGGCVSTAYDIIILTEYSKVWYSTDSMDEDIDSIVSTIQFRLGRIRLEADELVELIEKRTGKIFSPAFIAALKGVGSAPRHNRPYIELLDALNRLSPPKSRIKVKRIDRKMRLQNPA